MSQVLTARIETIADDRFSLVTRNGVEQYECGARSGRLSLRMEACINTWSRWLAIQERAPGGSGLISALLFLYAHIVCRNGVHGDAHLVALLLLA